MSYSAVSEKISVRPRIVHVISGDLWAGAEVMAHDLICELGQRADMDVSAVLFNGGILAERLSDFGVDVLLLDESKMSSWTLFWSLFRYCRVTRPAIVHTHRQKENVIGSLVAYSVGARSLRTIHGWTEFAHAWWRVDKRLFRALDEFCGSWLQEKIVAVSADLKAKLSSTYDGNKIVVIENGISVESIRERSKQPSPKLKHPAKKSIGIVARLVPVKRHDRFLDAAELLLRTGPDAYEFHIIGDGPLREEIHRRIAESGRADAIRAHGFQENVPALLAQLDALVFCSDHEGLPMAALEAAVLGVPIVSTPRGVVCSEESPESIAEGIAAVTSSQLDSGPDIPSDWEFSAATMANRYRELYRSMIYGDEALLSSGPCS